MCKILITLVLTFCLINFVMARTKIEKQKKILGGNVAEIGQFPHAAYLILHLMGSMASFCGGSIINPNFVLTAAHCFDNVTRIEVRLGISSLSQAAPYQNVVEVGDFRQHPWYDRKHLFNDIGLIFLRRQVVFTANIRPIALPRRSQEFDRFVGDGATITGWGEFGTGSRSNDLRFVNLPIIPEQRCRDIYNKDIHFFNPTNICVSAARGSSCNGDSGSGQHITVNRVMTLIGVVSYGSESCHNGVPTVMTRITSYLGWISASTGIHRN